MEKPGDVFVSGQVDPRGIILKMQLKNKEEKIL